MVDPGFGVNAFNTPKFYNESETVGLNILMLLHGKPGFYPSIPDLGMDIKSVFYDYFDDINTEGIKTELVRQCNKFITNIRDGSFDVRKSIYKEKPMLVFLIPLFVKQSPQKLAIAITTNENGELIYKMDYAEDIT